MKHIKLYEPTPFADRTEAWLSSLERLTWQPWELHDCVHAAFAKAVWLGVSPLVAVPKVEELCARHHQALTNETLWAVWFEILRELNGAPEEAELDVA